MKPNGLNFSKSWLAVTLVAVMTLAAACTPSTPTTTTPPATTKPPAATTTAAAPTITITAPKDGSSVAAGGVTVTVSTANIALTPIGQPNATGQGHIHFFLDVTPPTDPGKPAVTAAGTYAAQPGTSYTWPNVAAGSHTLSVELVNNDHTPLVPPVVQKVTVTVAAASPTTAAPPAASSPTVTITAPADGSSVAAGGVTVTVSTANIALTPIGQPNAPGQGHIHFFLDVTPPTDPGKPAVTAAGTYAAQPGTSYTWPNVAAGSHTLSVELVNNDHTPLVPPVVQKVTVTVAAASPTATASPAASAPTITVTAPKDGSIVPPGGVTVTVSTTNFALTPLGQPNAPGQGHIHFFLDVIPPTDPGKPAVTAAGTYAAQPGTSYTWPNVAAGAHTLSVELVNNDHTPLVPPVVMQLVVTVGTPAPAGGLGY